jgi:hypothetical protein
MVWLLGLTCCVKSPGEGLTGWKLKWYSGLAIDLVLPSTSTTWMVAEVKMLGKAEPPCGG